MSRGGPRPGSGRKSNAELAQCHAQMDAAITPDDWNAIYARLVQIAKEGDAHSAVQAARLLIHQRWGDGAIPPADPDDADDVCEIKFIHVDTGAPDQSDQPDEEDAPDDDTGETTGDEIATGDSQSAIGNQKSEIAARRSPIGRAHRSRPDLPLPPRPAPGLEQQRPVCGSPGRHPGR